MMWRDGVGSGGGKTGSTGERLGDRWAAVTAGPKLGRAPTIPSPAPPLSGGGSSIFLPEVVAADRIFAAEEQFAVRDHRVRPIVLGDVCFELAHDGECFGR